ncbi:Ig-like domain-containing protein [Algibacillus agarilyticus]|uniref:Ig-like domain-containing protein n=1 Tax=Algibacillus agarilyticus TaxID=2234133 RepID=UPI000DD0764F|nr:Ig-like domain-containing protein [Algibacillus agarilyticus]
MKTTLLKNTFVMVSIAAALAGCSDVEEGRDFNFGNEEAVTYSDDSINKTFAEDSGIVTIDLFEGAMSNGEALTASSTGILVREFSFENAGGTDETNLAPPVDAEDFSPFRHEGNVLTVNTDLFSNLLHQCGDKPQHTYTINYVLDNGFTPPYTGEARDPDELRPGARKLNLTLTGNEDALASINITDNDAAIPASVGGNTQLMAVALPEYACNKNYTWSVSDTDIATVNAATGMLTGVKAGTVTVTITSEVGGLVDTATVEVKNAPIGVASIAIDNAAKRSVPSCSAAAFNVVPTAKTGETLSGTFVYTWSSDADQFDLISSSANADFSEMAYLRADTNDAVATDKMVSVNLSAGNIADATAAIDIENNLACGATGNFDQSFESIAGVWGTLPSSGLATLTTTPQGLSGGGYVFTMNRDPNAGEEYGFNSLNFNRGNTANNVLAREFGLLRDKADNGGSWGKEIKASMWVKVVKADNSTTADSVKLTHTILPWLSTPGGARPAKRALSPEFVGMITPGEWQYIEFVDQQWDNDATTSAATFTVPTTWTHRTGEGATSVIPEFLFEGLMQGDQVFVDDYAVVRVDQ